MSRLIFIALVIAALALAETVYYLVRYLDERRTEDLRRRLRRSGTEPGVALTRPPVLASAAWLRRLLGSFRPLVRWGQLIEEADVPVSVARLLAYTAALGLAGAALGALAGSWMVGLLAALLLAALPVILVAVARSRRMQRISRQLPDALDMLGRALRAGHGLPAAYRLVADELAPPLAIEFGRAWEQQNLGLSIEAATQAMAERLHSNLDVRLLTVAIVLARETGGNLVEILEALADTIRERFAFRSKLRVLTAEGRISGLILGALPFVVALALWRLNPEYIGELGKGLGRVVLASAIGLWTIGVLWIRSLMRVEF